MLPIHIQNFINQHDGMTKKVIYALFSGEKLSRHSDIFTKKTNACHSYISIIRNHIYLPVKKQKIKGSNVVEYYIDKRDLNYMFSSPSNMAKAIKKQKAMAERNKALKDLATYFKLKEKYAL